MRWEFNITVIDDKDIAKAAANGVAKPASAKGTAIKLYNAAIAKFCFDKTCVDFATFNTMGKSAKLSFSNTISAAFRDASSAVDGAIDACATDNAAVSFKPSPTIKVCFPASRN